MSESGSKIYSLPVVQGGRCENVVEKSCARITVSKMSAYTPLCDAQLHCHKKLKRLSLRDRCT